MARGMQWDKAAGRDRVRDTRPEPAGELTYWLTIFKNGSRCSNCGNAGTVLAYRHADQDTLCQACVERMGIQAKPSKRYLASQGPAEGKKRNRRRRRRR